MTIRGHGGVYEVSSLSLPVTQPTFSIENTEGKVIAIKQTISAGNNFTGVAPTTTPVLSGNGYTYPADSQGGLFDPGNTSNTLAVAGIYIDFADQTSWKLEIVDNDANPVVLFSGTTEDEFAVTADTVIFVLPGETLKLTTVGATAAISAIIEFRNARAK